VSVNDAVAVAAGDSESLAWTVKVCVSWFVGVPLIKPDVLSVRPAGRVPEVMDQVYGGTPPVAVSTAL